MASLTFSSCFHTKLVLNQSRIKFGVSLYLARNLTSVSSARENVRISQTPGSHSSPKLFNISKTSGIPGKSKTSEQWQLMSAACVERLPVIVEEPNKIEQEYGRMMAKLELENSCLSDHSLRLAEDLRLVEKKKQEGYEESEIVRSTAVEEQDAWEEDLKSFTPASRITDADIDNDVRSTERKLNRKLMLVVNQKLGMTDKYSWILPMGLRTEGESMRQAAERALATVCGSTLQATFLGNAPCSFYKYRYPASVQEASGYTGAKVFFFKAQLCRGGTGSVVLNSKSASDYMWLSIDELNKHLVPMYHKKITKFMMEL